MRLSLAPARRIATLATARGGEPHRFAAVATLSVSAAGLVLPGSGPAFWGLAAGLATPARERLAATLGGVQGGPG